MFALSLLGYVWLSYNTLRSDFYDLILLYTGLAILGIGAFRMVGEKSEFRLALVAALVFRIALLYSLPNLSDDFYRFYWDGQLLYNGIAPFEHIPKEYIDGSQVGHGIEALNQDLYDKLNSKEYFTIYPPVCQFVFWVATAFSPQGIWGAVVIMKLFMLLFEIGTAFFLIRLLQHFKMRPELSLLYLLNPLVIIELTGNIHFEAGMVCFSLMAVYLLVKNQWIWSAVAMALAICTKLLPLIFLPFLLRRLGGDGKNIDELSSDKDERRSRLSLYGGLFINSLRYYAVVGLVCVVLFLPLIDWATLQNILASMDLYFQKFEFNASIFYVVRTIGFWVKGWNIIQTAGPIMAIMVFIAIMVMMVLEGPLTHKNLFMMMLWALFVYLIMATLVHPWYITPLIAYCIFTNFRFPVVWAIVIPLSYYTYISDAYTENFYLIAFEYAAVFGFIVYEFVCKKRQEEQFDKICVLERNCILRKS